MLDFFALGQKNGRRVLKWPWRIVFVEMRFVSGSSIVLSHRKN